MFLLFFLSWGLILYSNFRYAHIMPPFFTVRVLYLKNGQDEPNSSFDNIFLMLNFYPQYVQLISNNNKNNKTRYGFNKYV